MKVKNVLGILLMTTMAQGVAFGDSCEPTSSSWDSSLTSEQCATVTTGVVTASASGIFSAKKYSEARIYEDKYTKTVFSSEKAAVMDPRDGQRYVRQMTNGGKIVFQYELNEIQNRLHHIELMEQRASSARSRASSERFRAMTAMKTVSSGSGKNRTTRRVPDHFARMSAAANAVRLDAEAVSYDQKAAAARAGGKVPTYTFDKTITAENGTRNLAQDFIDERAKNTSKIKLITRLPVTNFNALKSIINKGRAGLVGVGAGLLFAGEELISGAVAEELEENDIPFKIDLSDGN